MANVIDSFFITLGLDVSQFNKDKQKAIDGLKEIDKQEDQLSEKKTKRTKKNSSEEKNANQDQEKNSKERKKRNKDEEKSIESMTDSVIKFGAALVTVGAAKDFIVNMVQSNAQLGRTSKLLGISSTELDAWGAAAKTTGGDAKSFQNAIQNIQSGLAKFQIGQGGQDIVQTLAQLGVQANKGKVNLLDLGDALKKIRESQGELAAKSFAERLGFDESGYFLLTKNRDELEKLVSEMEKLSGASEKNSEGAQRLEASWAKFTQSISGSSNSLFVSLIPALEKVLELVSTLYKYAAFAFKKNPIVKLWGKVFSSEEKDTTQQNKSGKIGNQSSNETVSDGDPKSMIGYFKSKGWTEEQSRGIVANIMRESAGKSDAVGDNGKAYGLGQWHPDRQENFKKLFGKDIRQSNSEEQMAFFDYELRNTEKKAGDALQKTSSSGEAAKVVSLMHERPANSYIEASRRADIANNLPYGEPQQSQTSQPAPATVQTNIQTINVTTQAKDAYGVADGMRDALAKNQLVNFGVGGAR